MTIQTRINSAATKAKDAGLAVVNVTAAAVIIPTTLFVVLPVVAAAETFVDNVEHTKDFVANLKK